jgi:hypothetical protein
VTRAGGPVPDFTRLDADAKSGTLSRLAAANAFFDDRAHWAEMRALTALTHPRLADDGNGGRPPLFASMKALRAALRERGLHLCDVCVDGRKVFAAEQEVYSAARLARHKATGDTAGPLAAAGFRGHPLCQFCRRRFYGDGELFAHMQAAHEHCFLCRRAQPAAYEYYRDYDDLASHFAAAHHACPHPTCTAARFVVFGSAAELAAHGAREHAGEGGGGGASRAERRAALTIPIDLQYARGG